LKVRNRDTRKLTVAEPVWLESAGEMRFRITIAGAMLISAAPAAAQGIAQVPEASSLTLFGLGVAGVLIGRRLSMRGKDRD